MIAIARFIVDGIITLPIALYGYLVFPDVPAITNAFYLTDEVCVLGGPGKSITYFCAQERRLAVKRLETDDFEVSRSNPFSLKLVKRVLSRWRWYGCSLLVRRCSGRQIDVINSRRSSVVRDLWRDRVLRH